MGIVRHSQWAGAEGIRFKFRHASRSPHVQELTGEAERVDDVDRLARSTRDLLNVIDAITKRGAGFRSLKDTWADTTSPHGRLMLTVLGGLAEFERELIRARTGEGRKRAKERGVRFGRPRKLTPHQREEALRRLAAGETQADVANGTRVVETVIKLMPSEVAQTPAAAAISRRCFSTSRCAHH